MSTISSAVLGAKIAADAQSTAGVRMRLGAIDAVRGLVIVLMALDHVRHYFTDVRFDPLDLSQTSTALFVTRWITHLCAPTFIFLAGLSAHLMAQRMSLIDVQRFLVTRGLWLIALEFTVVRFAWTFNLRYEEGFILQVIWAIGASMVALAALVRLPRRAILLIALAMIFGHNLLDGLTPDMFGEWGWIWRLLHEGGPTPYAVVIYPLIPWIGVTAIGYCAGALYEMDADARSHLLVRGAIVSFALFVVLRLTNVYGDPAPWTAEGGRALLAFFNVDKYPPSLQYLLIMLGLAALLLARFEHARGALARVLQTFGRTPLFVYVAHIVLAHLCAGLIALASGHGASVLTSGFFLLPESWGFALPIVYLAWLLVLVALYPACRWFGELKRRRRQWWLSYL